MADQQLPRIILPPLSKTQAVTNPTSTQLAPKAPPPVETKAKAAPMPLASPDSMPTVTPPSPIPTPIPSLSLSRPKANLKERNAELKKQLEELGSQENKLLGTIKEWVSWIQGAETKRQALERELITVERQLQESASPSAAIAEIKQQLHEQLREAETQFKTLRDQQKIEEKKAFDLYESGKLNREGLMKAMDQISARYEPSVAEAKAKVDVLRAELEKLEQPSASPATPSQVTPPATKPAITTPPKPQESKGPPSAKKSTAESPKASLNPTEKILGRLRTLERAQGGAVRKILVELPEQGKALTIQRSADGNGIIVLAGNEKSYTLAQHFPDSDLIRAGLGIDDIISLPTGTLTPAQLNNSTNMSL